MVNTSPNDKLMPKSNTK